jgi:hypothetical protein
MITEILKGPGWQDINVALPILQEGISIRQLEIIRFALKIHIEGIIFQFHTNYRITWQIYLFFFFFV